MPTPIVAFACIGSVDIRVFSGAGGQLYLIRRLQAYLFIIFRVQTISQGVTLLFSLLKRKKEAKKEKQKKKRVRLPLHYAVMYHTKITQETVTINSHQQKSPGGVTGGCCRRNTTLFTVEIGA
ncbi:hypothetical protein [Ruminococcus sp.]